MPKNKTDNFLKAIRRYAKQQKSVMKGEVKQLKTERLKEAEEKAKRDSQRLIKDKLQETRTRQTAILAKKTQDGQRKLFIARSAMVEEVFKKAADKLVEYAKSDAYTSKLTDSAKAIADVFDGRDCVLYVNERDLGAAEGIKALFGGSTEVRADKTIKIGGIRGYCASMGIIADETLDSKLEAQREWFVENAALSVL
ncbi:V-type ATP synthase subunit E [Ruminococcus difficilis]|uniref:V-type ATP synthase subunit E n=1 Tax=Ruminococcus difficilis TaxID=2763069 RepID=A0A934WS71_9FIRM|nr:V-type ATP synthase subunit E [Ruminococcus difficilis]MBK6088945.1 V-type ATP synthase subunit E [Ruminococcus difficilis]MBQ1351088.1 V-type ATP synthase subunit E [Ruminococcus sp.]MBQ1616977.1 V-type ATP synthase subunit E [Ruminococcus sp.]MBQ4261097.1 V-type ATP synthase subunit E [Ruminococcus sp.]